MTTIERPAESAMAADVNGLHGFLVMRSGISFMPISDIMST